MIRPILLAGAVALAAPSFAQNATNDDMAPPLTTGVAAPNAQDQAAPNLAPGVVPTGTADDRTTDHEGMVHSPADTSATTGTARTQSASPTAVRTGVGGPMEATEYPVCTRAITDNCLQTPRSPRPRG